MTVECQWSLWSNGACSKSCGVGQRKRTRTKMVAEKFGGACNGQSIKYESCNIQPCPGRYKNFNKHETNQSRSIKQRIAFLVLIDLTSPCPQ